VRGRCTQGFGGPYIKKPIISYNETKTSIPTIYYSGLKYKTKTIKSIQNTPLAPGLHFYIHHLRILNGGADKSLVRPAS
jgi:hypothetical protein